MVTYPTTKVPTLMCDNHVPIQGLKRRDYWLDYSALQSSKRVQLTGKSFRTRPKPYRNAADTTKKNFISCHNSHNVTAEVQSWLKSTTTRNNSPTAANCHNPSLHLLHYCTVQV